MGEVCVFLGYADIKPRIRGVERANQETSVCVDNTLIQLDLGGKQKIKDLPVESLKSGVLSAL